MYGEWFDMYMSGLMCMVSGLTSIASDTSHFLLSNSFVHPLSHPFFSYFISINLTIIVTCYLSCPALNFIVAIHCQSTLFSAVKIVSCRITTRLHWHQFSAGMFIVRSVGSVHWVPRSYVLSVTWLRLLLTCGGFFCRADWSFPIFFFYPHCIPDRLIFQELWGGVNSILSRWQKLVKKWQLWWLFLFWWHIMVVHISFCGIWLNSVHSVNVLKVYRCWCIMEPLKWTMLPSFCSSQLYYH